jgi:predicted ATP pyrophosphatase (TIGR00289 family)
MGIRHIWRDTEGNKEVELDDLRAAIESVKGEIEGVLSGAVSSRYQKTRIESICSQLGLESISPLWGMDPYKLLKEEVEMMDIIVVAVSTAGLDSRWLGKRLGDAEVDELHRISQKSHFNIQFEGGEAETFVADCPLFSKRIEIEDYDKVWDSTTSSGYIQVKEVNLIQKRI